MKEIIAASALITTLLMSVGAQAGEYEVKLLNKSTDGMMAFEPSLVEIAPGDTVHFIATDKGHNVETIDGMLPEGAQPFKGESGKDLTVTFDRPSVYGIKCKPHYSMGMVGLVVVGDPVNTTQAAAIEQKGKAKQKFEKLLGEIGG